MTIKFNKEGKTVAVLKDSASEPEGFVYVEGQVLPDDIADELELDDVMSLEELDAEENKTE